MECLDGEYYVEVKDNGHKFHPTKTNILRKRDPPKSVRTQYQVQKTTQTKKNQKVIKNDNDELEVRNYPKKTNRLLNNPKLNHQNVSNVNEIIG